MDPLFQDIRYAVRAMLRKPGFTTSIVLVLALGIGANSVLFGIVDAALLRPLPYPESQRIVSISMASSSSDVGRLDDQTAQLIDRSPLRTFDAVAISNGSGANLTGGDTPERVAGARVSAGFFRVLGTVPTLGRSFAADELLEGGPRVAILGNGLWKRAFGADPSVIGRKVELDDRGYTVVGVMPEGFRYPYDAEYWLPRPPPAPVEGGGYLFVDGVGRLRPDASIESGLAELQALRRQHATELPAGVSDTRLHAMTLHERAYGDLRPALLILFGTVGCVLLVACANVANLLPARASTRHKEFALRTARGFQMTRRHQPAKDSPADNALARYAVSTVGTQYFHVFGVPVLAGREFTEQDEAGTDALFSESVAPRKFSLILIGSFATLACVLAAVGLYGVIAFLVAQRTREIGLRMALGAEAPRVVLTVMREGLIVTMAGLAAGVAASLVLSRVLDGMLFQITSHDPMVFVGVPLVLLAVAALAVGRAPCAQSEPRGPGRGAAGGIAMHTGRLVRPRCSDGPEELLPPVSGRHSHPSPRSLP